MVIMLKAEPIYVQIKKYLESLIIQNKNVPHFKLPSENQIAGHFHSSRIPVKRAFSELENEGHIYRQQGKGSFICPNIIHQNKENESSVCLLIPHLGYKLVDDMINGIQPVLDTQGIKLYISLTGDSPTKEETFLQAALNRHFDGLLVFPVVHQTYNDNLLQLVLRQYPIVLIGRSLPGLNISSVICDHYKQAYHTTKHLIDQGHREIGFLSEAAATSPFYAERLLGYRTCILENFTYSFILQEEINFFDNNCMEDSITNAILRLFSKNPTAIITTNNAILRLYQMMEQYGRNIKVATFDESYNTGMYPCPPIIVHQNPIAIGTLAAEQLCKQMASHVSPQQILVDEMILDPIDKDTYNRFLSKTSAVKS